jgi:hypothetical protein
MQTTLQPTDTNIPIGDIISPIKPTNSIRFYYQNINGIKCNNKWDKWETGVKWSQEHNIDVNMLVETNLH